MYSLCRISYRHVRGLALIRHSVKYYSDNSNDNQKTTLQIPPFVENHKESSANKRRRLQYQSRKRGMLENCILLSTFAAKHLQSFDDAQLAMYDSLINQPSNDWDIYYWITGVKDTPDTFNNVVMDLLKKHVKNSEKELRAVQPELFFSD